MEKLEKIVQLLSSKKAKISYAQYGEDLIIRGAFDILKIKNPTYIEIGTHHPTLINNTYLFYISGSNGLCIEPSQKLFKKIKQKRKRDICLNVGISDKEEKGVPYYVMTAQTLNTFSKTEAEQNQNAVEAYGLQKIEKIEKIDLVPMQSILEKYFLQFPDLLSIDTEGMDEKIVRSIDFSLYRPKIICLETIEQNKEGIFIKNNHLIEFMEKQNYFIYADTHVNTIFIDKHIWKI